MLRPSTMLRHARRRRRLLSSSSTSSSPYLHETTIPTYHFQDSLPRLPIPELDATLDRFLYFAEPVCVTAQLAAARAAADEMRGPVGQRVQAELKRAAGATYSSFISKPWFDMYLEDRRPLLLNSNPQLTLKDDPARRDAASRAASLVHSSVRFFLTLRDERLRPDVFHTKPHLSEHPVASRALSLTPRAASFYAAAAMGAYPLDMSQYANLFQSTRVPKQGRDELRTFQDSKHVIVQRGPDFFALRVLEDDGITPVPVVTLEAALRDILAAPAAQAGTPAAAPVGALTALPRDEWAAMRARMEAHGPTRQALETVDSALFAISLHGDSHGSIAGEDILSRVDDGGEIASERETGPGLMTHLLHGDPDCTDRWLDKSFQLILTGDGRGAVSFEHAWGDGVAVLRYVNEIFQDSIDTPAVDSRCHSSSVNAGDSQGLGVTRIDWDLAALPDVLTAVQGAQQHVRRMTDAADSDAVVTNALTKARLKQHKLSPDGTLQMIMQLAYFRMHGTAASTYESASTSAFKHGRTETIRSATKESAAFTQAFSDPSVSDAAAVASLRAAVKNHSRLTRDAVMGKGFDRHLFALRRTARDMGLESDFALFQHSDGNSNGESDGLTALDVLDKIIISTSTLSSDALVAGGFGPVNADCYAVGYGIKDAGCRFGAMTYKGDAASFVSHCEKAAEEVRRRLDRVAKEEEAAGGTR